jgi:hypothetical protein
MPNPTFVKFAGEMEALFSQREIEHEEFFITDLKNVESGGNFQCFQAWKLKEFHRFKEHRKVFLLFIVF